MGKFYIILLILYNKVIIFARVIWEVNERNIVRIYVDSHIIW